MNKLGNLATLAGLVSVGLYSSIYCVDPGEKALIMDNFYGLKQTVYGQGYHLLIPFIQVIFMPCYRNQLFTIAG
jgi:prohibitin 1